MPLHCVERGENGGEGGGGDGQPGLEGPAGTPALYWALQPQAALEALLVPHKEACGWPVSE